MFDIARGVIRGGFAVLGGYLCTLALVVGGLVEAPAGAAHALLDAHTIVLGSGTAPVTLVGVPLVVLGLAGYRIGNGVGTGVVGRLRASVTSLFGSNTNQTRGALVGVGYLALGYALSVALASAVVDVSIGETAVGAFVVAALAGAVGALVGVR
ncbi:hypothetical protein Halru_0306 [Halovivax ruber XH-70]|uniref:Uncharacterized protein n=1 Tax=Halovivax ruber (strain DSM 18193 / JCM 13892 / XH-70) TaxID=797302 RepID=L0I5Z9_HALRX|nr:hypothetical protein [Halovivax ruber]AGB14950.1 hypothetical protein Halru_0306 [Halovivax ruber XH-70]